MKNKFGIYIHVPFCNSKCNYCNFYSLVNTALIEPYSVAIAKEIVDRKNVEKGEVASIYFGGGTPSMMSVDWFKKMFEIIYSNYSVAANAEITVETNPDHINSKFLHEIKPLINRLSIGTQSFNDGVLKYLSRKHTAQVGIDSIKLAQDAGFDNITADLIYGVPGLSNHAFQDDVNQFLALKVPHISAYALTVEDKTKLSIDVLKGRVSEPLQNEAGKQFLFLMKALKKAGFHHYEISNFALPNYEAKHNSSYWSGQHYLGFGPSAHSYNGDERRWNISSVAQYVAKIKNQEIYFEKEILSPINKLNEYIMIGLRTSAGISLNKIASDCSTELFALFQKNLSQINPSFYQLSNEIMILTDSGKLFADGIAASLFFEE